MTSTLTLILVFSVSLCVSSLFSVVQDLGFPNPTPAFQTSVLAKALIVTDNDGVFCFTTVQCHLRPHRAGA